MKKVLTAIAFSVATLMSVPASAIVLYNGSVTTTPTQDLFMFPGDRITSPEGKYMAIMQNDGNFAIYRERDGRMIFSTETKNRGVYASMKKDHSFAVYDGLGQQVWTSGIAHQVFDAKTRLVMTDQGRLQVHGSLDVNGTPREWQWFSTNFDNRTKTCENGPPTLYPICFYKMNTMTAACTLEEAVAFGNANGSYGACP